MSRERIWELDALRGVCILCMVAIHLLFDLVSLFGILQWTFPPVLSFIQTWGGAIFVILSGICATLGSHSVRRGLVVLGCGLLVSAVTVGLYRLGFSGKDIIIYFGVLHCLGVCMLLWPFLKKLPVWAMGVLGGVLTAAGLFIRNMTLDVPYLIWLGFTFPGFVTSDYFPLLPHLGFFLLGAFAGKRLYGQKRTLLPNVNADCAAIRFFRWCGRHSLAIYMLHQPALMLLTGAAKRLLP